MPPSGHWFCERCDDTVTLSMPPTVEAANAAIDTPEKCPRCHNRTAFFKLALASSQQASNDHRLADSESAPTKNRTDPEWAKQQFEQMRRANGG